MDNVAFGSGGGLLQDCNRDTMSFALKCSQARVNGVLRDVYKAPATDPAKNSKRGRLALVKNGQGEYTTVRNVPLRHDDLLTLAFRDGRVQRNEILYEIRQRAELPGLAKG